MKHNKWHWERALNAFICFWCYFEWFSWKFYFHSHGELLKFLWKRFRNSTLEYALSHLDYSLPNVFSAKQLNKHVYELSESAEERSWWFRWYDTNTQISLSKLLCLVEIEAHTYKELLFRKRQYSWRLNRRTANTEYFHSKRQHFYEILCKFRVSIAIQSGSYRTGLLKKFSFSFVYLFFIKMHVIWHTKNNRKRDTHVRFQRMKWAENALK